MGVFSIAVPDAVGSSVTARERRTVKFVSTRIITADVPRLVAFYEMVTGASAVWGNELFAEIPTPVGVLAIGSDKTVALFGQGSAEPAANRSAIFEFLGMSACCGGVFWSER